MRIALMILTWIGLTTATLAQPANLQRAAPGYLYFNRAGADMATHDSELKNCIETWNGGVPPPAAYADRVQHGLVSNLVTDIMNANWDRARRAVNVEHCMVVRGWRLMRLEAAVGVRLASLDREALAAELEPYIGSVTPPGEMAREWRNEAAIPGTIIGRSPSAARRVLLSELAMNVDAGPAAQPVNVDAGAWTHWNRNDVRAADLTRLSEVPSGMAFIVVGVSMRNSDYGSAIIMLDRASDVRVRWDVVELDGRVTTRQGDRRAGMRAFVVEPGRWRVYGYGVLFDYCLGAPFVDVQAGQVVFLGNFDLSARLQPNLDLAPARDFLARNSTLLDSLTAAEWRNGATWPCRMMSPYALEFDGTPFEADYTWGSAMAARAGGGN